MVKRADLPISLDDLPMFASDMQIAEAIVGRERAKDWVRDRLPTLAGKPGFPPVDAFHGGRPVKLVIRFYDAYLGSDAGGGSEPAQKRATMDRNAWKPSRPRA